MRLNQYIEQHEGFTLVAISKAKACCALIERFGLQDCVFGLISCVASSGMGTLKSIVRSSRATTRTTWCVNQSQTDWLVLLLFAPRSSGLVQ